MCDFSLEHLALVGRILAPFDIGMSDAQGPRAGIRAAACWCRDPVTSLSGYAPRKRAQPGETALSLGYMSIRP
jgi:hypothetical protein